MVKNYGKLQKKSQISRQILKKHSIILKNCKKTVKNIEKPSNMSKTRREMAQNSEKIINKPLRMWKIMKNDQKC